MTVVLDHTGRRPRHPEKAHRPDTPTLRKPDWIRVKAPVSKGYAATQAIVRAERPAHGLRGGRLPQHRRVLGEEARHLHDPGRHLHARLRLLQRQDRPAGPARSRTSPTMSREATAKLGLAHVVVTSVDRDDLDDGGAQHFADTIRAIRARCPRHHHRGADARFPAQGRRGRARGRGAARRVQPQSRNRAVALSDGAAGRALFPLAAAAAAGQGNRPDDVHQVRHHGRPRRGAKRGAAGDGRPALGRRRFPHHRPVSAADPQASSGDAFRAARTSSRRSRPSPTPRAS